ncbi:MAG: Maf family protein [Treponema sp.]|jgi:septum formation protein|nr:Maf family protein [Treponema sp.]
MEPIILASGSPRRRDYFTLLGLPFEVLPAMIEEVPQEGLSPRQTAESFAVQKVYGALELAKGRPERWICGADTVVSVGSAVFGKPAGREDAKRMLGLLSGREHEVISAVALYNGREGKTDCRSVSCLVTFAPLGEAEIEWYLNAGEWEGAAGGYRIQGLASCFISSITGSPSAVAGLPLRDFYVMLRENGYPYGAPFTVRAVGP